MEEPYSTWLFFEPSKRKLRQLVISMSCSLPSGEIFFALVQVTLWNNSFSGSITNMAVDSVGSCRHSELDSYMKSYAMTSDQFLVTGLIGFR